MIREFGPNDIVYLLEAARWTVAQIGRAHV